MKLQIVIQMHTLTMSYSSYECNVYLYHICVYVRFIYLIIQNKHYNIQSASCLTNRWCLFAGFKVLAFSANSACSSFLLQSSTLNNEFFCCCCCDRHHRRKEISLLMISRRSTVLTHFCFQQYLFFHLSLTFFLQKKKRMTYVLIAQCSLPIHWYLQLSPLSSIIHISFTRATYIVLCLSFKFLQMSWIRICFGMCVSRVCMCF